jgi:hypothetical protein
LGTNEQWGSTAYFDQYTPSPQPDLGIKAVMLERAEDLGQKTVYGVLLKQISSTSAVYERIGLVISHYLYSEPAGERGIKRLRAEERVDILLASLPLEDLTIV